ncbi:MAG TPA: hypothetical protein VGX71_19620 [Pseudaminobacter sp.]|nr:hypothetical protein [Pseudaminobacter sp.]
MSWPLTFSPSIDAGFIFASSSPPARASSGSSLPLDASRKVSLPASCATSGGLPDRKRSTSWRAISENEIASLWISILGLAASKSAMTLSMPGRVVPSADAQLANVMVTLSCAFAVAIAMPRVSAVEATRTGASPSLLKRNIKTSLSFQIAALTSSKRATPAIRRA